MMSPQVRGHLPSTQCVCVCVSLQALSPSDKKCFEDMAKADKVRYNREMKDYVPPKGFGKRGRKRKDPNAPKRPP